MASRVCGWHGSGRPLGECTAGRHGLLHSTKNGCKRLSRWRAAATSACAGSERSQPGLGKVGGRARRRSLCARCSRLVWQVSPRAARHARTHEYLMHHTAWTACSPHVLAGRSNAMRSTHTMDVYVFTNRGQLDLMVVQAVVQWFASFCCMC